MKRVITLGSALSCLLFLQACSPEPEPAPVSEPTQASQLDPTDWVRVEEGIRVVRFWKTIGPEDPEIAVLRLSDERHAELQEDPKAFFNRYGIFSADVKELDSCPAQAARTPPKSGNSWYVLARHRPTSMGRAASVEG